MQPGLRPLVDLLAARLGPLGVISDSDGRVPYESSARHGHGHACAVVRPTTREELAWVVEQLVRAGAAFVVQGAGTGIVVPTDAPDEAVSALRDAVYALTFREFDGSFSAEHGVGPYNQRWYVEYTEPAKLELAATLHQHFDASRLLGNVRLDNHTQ